MRFKTLVRTIKRTIKMYWAERWSPDLSSNDSKQNNDIEKKKKGKDSNRLSGFIAIAFILFGFFLLFGCSKNQDVKIVHNYWDKMPTFAEKKQQSYIDLYVYKTYKDAKGKESITIYKAE